MTNKLNEATKCMLEEIDLVKVTFGLASQSAKSYTYKAPRSEYEANNLAVVIDPKGNFKFVQVLSIVPREKMPSLLDVPYDLAWLLCRVKDETTDLQTKEASWL